MDFFPVNPVKRKLQQGEAALGTFLNLPAAGAVEMAAGAGFDWIVLDNEHGWLDHALESMVLACEAWGVVPLIRVPRNRPEYILKVLDLGAMGFHVPWIQTRAEAEAAVEAAKYPPLGLRGAAFSTRAARYGRRRFHEYMDWANRETMVIIHLETTEALARAGEILAVPGIDVCFIGPVDLSTSMGHGGKQEPAVLTLIETGLAACQRAGVPAGMMCSSAAEARKYAAMGFTYIATSGSGIITGAFKATVDGFRA